MRKKAHDTFKDFWLGVNKNPKRINMSPPAPLGGPRPAKEPERDLQDKTWSPWNPFPRVTLCSPGNFFLPDRGLGRLVRVSVALGGNYFACSSSTASMRVW